MPKLLLIDDDKSILKTLELHFRSLGYDVRIAGDLASARQAYDVERPDAIILDLKLPDGLGTDFLKRIAITSNPPPVIMLTGHHELEYAIEAMKSGAFDYVQKPPDIDQIEALVEKAVEQNRKSTSLQIQTGVNDGGRISGISPAVLNLHKMIGTAARSRITVLIEGESGSGKELTARAIHHYSSPNEPFVALNCGAIAPTLADSEFFGHEQGAFTDAKGKRIGRFEEAGLGTIFLDEVSELTSSLQVKLLRVLQERIFTRVGGHTPVQFRARIITASNKKLDELVQGGTFRTDLYYRLSPFIIKVPPLRERLEDIPLLVPQLVRRLSVEHRIPIGRVLDADVKRLQAYSWPGNVRELENVLLLALLRSSGEILNLREWKVPRPEGGRFADAGLESLDEVERKHIARVLDAVEGNLGAACDVLGISRPTLRKKIEEYGLKTR